MVIGVFSSFIARKASMVTFFRGLVGWVGDAEMRVRDRHLLMDSKLTWR